MTDQLFPYRWQLSAGYGRVPSSGLKVFGTFICGGGSTMGFKLAGYTHLGGVEIDPKIAEVYRKNHNPKYLYTEDIRSFIQRDDLPEDLYNLDVLEGSPPCSSFSMSGNRERDWGKEKVFREGQALQRLDDLFFDFIHLCGKLKPKVTTAENVKGLVAGNARAYVREICNAFKDIGYNVQVFILNAASMGVPQKRERVFFICHRKDLDLPKLRLDFRQKPIVFAEIEDQVADPFGKDITETIRFYWEKAKPGQDLGKVHPKGHFFTSFKISRNKVINTIAANNGARYIHYSKPRKISNECLQLCGSFPLDFDFVSVEPQYIIGMSVPPVMMAQIAYQIRLQWFANNNILEFQTPIHAPEFKI